MSRVVRVFWGQCAPPQYPVVTVRGPHNHTSPKWTLDMTHSSLALYWEHDRERATDELRELRAALDFIEGQLLGLSQMTGIDG